MFELQVSGVVKEPHGLQCMFYKWWPAIPHKFPSPPPSPLPELSTLPPPQPLHIGRFPQAIKWAYGLLAPQWTPLSPLSVCGDPPGIRWSTDSELYSEIYSETSPLRQCSRWILRQRETHTEIEVWIWNFYSSSNFSNNIYTFTTLGQHG